MTRSGNREPPGVHPNCNHSQVRWPTGTPAFCDPTTQALPTLRVVRITKVGFQRSRIDWRNNNKTQISPPTLKFGVFHSDKPKIITFESSVWYFLVVLTVFPLETTIRWRLWHFFPDNMFFESLFLIGLQGNGYSFSISSTFLKLPDWVVLHYFAERSFSRIATLHNKMDWYNTTFPIQTNSMSP